MSAAEEAALATFRKQGTCKIDYCDYGIKEKCRLNFFSLKIIKIFI
jgi:hypothetical protein